MNKSKFTAASMASHHADRLMRCQPPRASHVVYCALTMKCASASAIIVFGPRANELIMRFLSSHELALLR